jgi:epoxyqueuosine reductase QueG
MPNEVTKLAPHVEQARMTLTQTAERERALVQALSDELKRFDQQTLQGVRTMAAEHEARRAGILEELQTLASSIGTFQPAREEPAAIPQHTVTSYPAAAATSGSYHDELERNLRALRDERAALRI